MVWTRLQKGGSQTTTPSPQKHQRHSNAEDLLDELLQDLSENNKDPQIIVPLSDKLKKYQHRLSGNSFVLIGSANAGKQSHILWLAKDLGEEKQGVETHMIIIDCRIYQSDSQFLGVLTRELRVFFGQDVISKNIVINESASINLQGLNKQFYKLKKKELLLVIKSAQILASQRRKQMILYNILEWLNNTDVKKYITILLLTRNITFVDKLQKRTKSRMNLPVIYLPKIKPAEVLQIIRRRIEYRKERTSKKSGALLLQKLMNALDGNKQLMNVMDQQYEYSPRDVTHYLKVMRLIITIDIQSLKTLQSVTQAQLNTIMAEGFSTYSEFSADYKIIAKNLFINLSIPEVLLLGFLRQRLMNQEGRKATEITLKLLLHDYKMVLQKKTVFEAGSICFYNDNVLEEGLIRLQDQNFLTVGKEKNLELLERAIVSQYSPEDIMAFFKAYFDKAEGCVPSFIVEIYHGTIYHDE